MQKKKAAKIKADQIELKTHSLANRVQFNLETEKSVTPENMLQIVEKSVAKQVKSAMRKNISGSTAVTVANPAVPGNGKKSKKTSTKRKTLQHQQEQQFAPPQKRQKSQQPPWAPQGRGRGRGRGRNTNNPYYNNTIPPEAHTHYWRAPTSGRHSARGGGRGGRQPGRGRGGRY